MAPSELKSFGFARSYFNHYYEIYLYGDEKTQHANLSRETESIITLKSTCYKFIKYLLTEEEFAIGMR